MKNKFLLHNFYILLSICYASGGGAAGRTRNFTFCGDVKLNGFADNSLYEKVATRQILSLHPSLEAHEVIFWGRIMLKFEICLGSFFGHDMGSGICERATITRPIMKNYVRYYRECNFHRVE